MKRTRMTDADLLEFVRANVVSADISYRGGTLKVDASDLFPEIDEQAFVGAYQNYLGGGIAGRIVGAAMFEPGDLRASRQEFFQRVLKACVTHFHELNGGGGDEYMQENYGDLDFNQNLPVSAY